MYLKTIAPEGDLCLVDYSREACQEIFLERNSYVLRVIHSFGEDYGGSHGSDERVVRYEEIMPERVLVRDGHFCGVIICTEYDDMNSWERNQVADAVIMCDGTGSRSAKCGYSFSNDDHSRWDYTEYYLMSRSSVEKMEDRKG